MHAIRGICDTLAKVEDSLLAHSVLKVYKPLKTDSAAGGVQFVAVTTSLFLYSALRHVTDVFFDATHHTTEIVHRNLQQTLAHEIDHLRYLTLRRRMRPSIPHSAA